MPPISLESHSCVGEQGSNENWNKITKLIINKDKKYFRNTLFTINDKLYKDLYKTMDKVDLEGNSRNLGSTQRSIQTQRKMSKANCFFSKRDQFKNKSIGRGSLLSNMILELREEKNDARKEIPKENFNSEDTQLSKQLEKLMAKQQLEKRKMSASVFCK